MIFDFVSGIVERNLLKLRPTFQESVIFDFKNVEPFTPPDYETLKKLCDMFILPFDTIVIERNQNFCILKTDNSNNIGINQRFQFLVYNKMIIQQMNFLEVWSLNKGYIEDIQLRRYEGEKFELYGFDTRDKSQYEYAYSIHMEDGWVINPENKKVEPLRFTKKPTDYYEAMAGHVIIILEQLLLLNTPNRFIVEVAPAKTRKLNPKRIMRSPDRSLYTLLTVKEIQKRYNLGKTKSKGDDKSPAPHPRRRHYRTLRSEKFTHKQGQTILIPATWIGKSEVQKGNRIYRVRFDV